MASNSYYLKHYGISLAEYDQLAQAQANLCAVCKKPPRPNQRLAVDHCHRTAKVEGIRASVRGLVHNYPCNYVLLRKNFSADMLDNAAAYLRDPPARKILEKTPQAATASTRRRARKGTFKRAA